MPSRPESPTVNPNVNIALVILWTRKYSDNVNIALNIVNIVIM